MSDTDEAELRWRIGRYRTDVERLRAEIERLRAALREARALVAKQAEDETLWFQAEYITEAILQQALRSLHAAVEGKEPPIFQHPTALSRKEES